MKTKIIIAQSVLIVVLLVLWVSRYVSLTTARPVVREPMAPEESSITYTPPPPPKYSAETISQLLDARKRNFTPAIDRIGDHIYLARGYMLGSIGMIVTDDGLVVVDAGESRDAAAEVLTELRKISTQPVKYVIYTHGHVDHVLGTASLLEEGTEVIATEAAVETMRKDLGWLDPTTGGCGSINTEPMRKTTL